MSTPHFLSNPVSETEFFERLLKYDIRRDGHSNVLHLHYAADETGPEEDAYMVVDIRADGLVEGFTRYAWCGRFADIINAIDAEFGPILTQHQ